MYTKHAFSSKHILWYNKKRIATTLFGFVTVKPTNKQTIRLIHFFVVFQKNN